MGAVNTYGLGALIKASGLKDDEAVIVADLVKALKANAARNAERTLYYAGEQTIKNIGIAIPQELTSLRMSCSWPAKAVDALADRSIIDGISFRSGENADVINDILARNHFSSMYDKAKRTEGIHGVSFWTVCRGKNEGDAPRIRQHSAESASAIWDDENERIAAGLVIASYDRRPGKQTKPNLVNVYTNDAILVFRLNGKSWSVDRLEQKMGRPLMEAMVHAPTTSKPLGTSRISRAVMSITDCAMRECLRSELHAEVYTSPQKFLIGATKSQMKSINRYDATYGAIFGLEYDEDAPTPQFGQLSQASMEPHISYMRQLAAQFAGATDIPISALGVIHDNPSSADAIHAAEQPLVIKAESMNANNAIAIEAVVQMALALQNNVSLDELPAEQKGVVVGFRRPDRPSVLSNANAAVMISSMNGMDWFGGSDVCQEMLGFSESDRVRLQADKHRAEGRETVRAFMQSRIGNSQITQLSENSAGDATDENNNPVSE